MLHTAAERIISSFPGKAVCSHTIETPAWGYTSAHPFLNMGMSITLDSEQSPLTVLRTLRAVERELSPAPHRDNSGRYIDRAIDIDLIAIDDMVIDTPELTLPHRHMHERDFVLIPLSETAPDWIHPTLRLTPGQLLSKSGRNNPANT